MTVFEREPHVLSSVDPDMAQIIEFELRRFGVEVLTTAQRPRARRARMGASTALSPPRAWASFLQTWFCWTRE